MPPFDFPLFQPLPRELKPFPPVTNPFPPVINPAHAVLAGTVNTNVEATTAVARMSVFIGLHPVESMRHRPRELAGE